VKKKVKKSPKAKKELPKPSMEVVMDVANPFDFGGLPQRDLKKNLGCG
jgi:hypothetical protein